MKQIVILCLLLAISGCCRKPIQSSERNVSDSVRVVTKVEYREVLRDTLIYVPVPAEEKERETRADNSFLETSISASEARINPDGSLYHKLWTKKHEIAVPVQVKDTEKIEATDTEHSNKEVERIVIRERYYPKLFWITLAISLLTIGYITVKIYLRLRRIL